MQNKAERQKIALFGSYGWGDGELMRNWAEECKVEGAKMVCDFVIFNEALDSDGEESCEKMGISIAG